MVVTLFLPQKKKSPHKKNVKLMGILSPKIKIFFAAKKKKSPQKKNVKLMGILSPKIKIFQLKLLTAE